MGALVYDRFQVEILIIDDVTERGDGLRSRLDDFGHSARWVHDPLFGLTLLGTARFDAVLLAADLPSALNAPR